MVVRGMVLSMLKRIIPLCLLVIAVLFILSQCGCTEKPEDASVMKLPVVEPPASELLDCKPTVCEPPPLIEEEWLLEVAPTVHQKKSLN